jgi:hypothetical protein
VPTTALCVLFNHAYPQNLPKLRRLHRERFDSPLFVLPMVRSAEPDVVTSYRSAFAFHGYVTDALPRLRAQNADYHVFVHDDVILNPRFDARNLVDRLRLADKDGFLVSYAALVDPFGQANWRWPWTLRALSRFMTGHERRLLGSGCENAYAQLPPHDEAVQRFAAHGLPGTTRITIDDVAMAKIAARFPPLPPGPGRKSTVTSIHEVLLAPLREPNTSLQLPFPLAAAWSDVFVVRADRLEAFAHYLGVFAALDVFAEVAIPTAMLFACDAIQTLAGAGLRAMLTLGQPFEISGVPVTDPEWDARARGVTRLDQLAGLFDDSLLAIHPIKLSRLQ